MAFVIAAIPCLLSHNDHVPKKSEESWEETVTYQGEFSHPRRQRGYWQKPGRGFEWDPCQPRTLHIVQIFALKFHSLISSSFSHTFLSQTHILSSLSPRVTSTNRETLRMWPTVLGWSGVTACKMPGFCSDMQTWSWDPRSIRLPGYLTFHMWINGIVANSLDLWFLGVFSLGLLSPPSEPLTCLPPYPPGTTDPSCLVSSEDVHFSLWLMVNILPLKQPVTISFLFFLPATCIMLWSFQRPTE